MYSNIDQDCMRPAVPSLYPTMEYMPIYNEPPIMMPEPHMRYPYGCPLMMNPTLRRCVEICMRQYMCSDMAIPNIDMPEFEMMNSMPLYQKGC